MMGASGTLESRFEDDSRRKPIRRWQLLAASIAIALTALLHPCGLAQSENIPAAENYRAAAESLSTTIAEEIQQKQIPALSVAVVDANGHERHVGGRHVVDGRDVAPTSGDPAGASW